MQLQTLHPDALDKIAKIELTGTLVTHSGDLGLTIVLCSILCVVFACKLNPLNPEKLRFDAFLYLLQRVEMLHQQLPKILDHPSLSLLSTKATRLLKVKVATWKPG